MAVAYVLDELSVDHRPPGPHPERPERWLAARDALRAAGLEQRGLALRGRGAALAELGRVHHASYLAELEHEVAGRAGFLDPDTYFCTETWPAALHAAGAAITVVEALIAGRARTGLAVVRPPGHHAEPDRAMGFCLLNNAAAAAAAARAAGLARVAIVDWDVHHGNGTQAIFAADPAVMYLSVHQYPFYPGTGAPTEIGSGEGRGATVNVGLPAGSGDPEWLAAFDHALVPALERFRPELILISAGFDAHGSDPLASMRVTEAGYGGMTARLVAVAERHAGGRVAAVLEGGYDLGGLGRSVAATFAALERPGAIEPVGPAAIAPEARAAIDRTRAAHGLEPCRDEDQ